MILEGILNLIKALLKVILGILPDLPSMSDNLLSSLNLVTDTIFGNANFLGFFIRISTIKFIIPMVILVMNFEHIYHFAIWVLHKFKME